MKKTEIINDKNPEKDKEVNNKPIYNNLTFEDKRIVIVLVSFVLACMFINYFIYFGADAVVSSDLSSSNTQSSSSSQSSNSSYVCAECGIRFSSQPYQCVMYRCFQDRYGNVTALDTYCSCSCGIRGMRRKGFRFECG